MKTLRGGTLIQERNGRSKEKRRSKLKWERRDPKMEVYYLSVFLQT